MSKAIVKAGYVCNNNCIFCHSNPKKRYDLCSLRDIERKVKKLHDNGIKEIYVSGGEPLIDKNILNIIEIIKKQGMRFGLISNLRMLSNKKLANELAGKGLSYVHTTLLGPNSRIHDAITRTPGSFNQTIRGIKNTLNNKIRMDINCVVIKQNINFLKEIVSLASDIGVKSLRFSFVEPITSEDKHVPRISLAARRIEEAIKNSKSGIKIGFDSIPLCLSASYDSYRENLITKNIGYISECYETEIFPADYGNKIKPKRCISCKRRNECEGVFEKYIEIYGDKELKPFNKAD